MKKKTVCDSFLAHFFSLSLCDTAQGKEWFIKCESELDVMQLVKLQQILA